MPELTRNAFSWFDGEGDEEGAGAGELGDEVDGRDFHVAARVVEASGEDADVSAECAGDVRLAPTDERSLANLLAGVHLVLIFYFLVGWLIPFTSLYRRALLNAINGGAFLFFRFFKFKQLPR